MVPETNIAPTKAQKSCKIEGCKRPYRAKGYCNVHYHNWRKGKLPKPRYQTCQYGVKKLKRGEKKECLRPVFCRGLCEEHYQAATKKKKETPVEATAQTPTTGS